MKNFKYAAIFGATFTMVFAALLFGLKMNVKQDGSNPTTGMVGKKAPNFTITTFKGQKIILNKLDKNKVVVINFWASWCGPCREEAKELENTWRKFKDRIYFIGLDYRDARSDALAFIKEFNITYPNGPIEDEIAADYGLTGVPETFIVKNGVIKEHIIGATTEETLSQAVNKLL